MKTIPQFTLDESEGIGAALDEAGVAYERQGMITSVSRYGGGTAFVFCVEDEQFLKAVEVIKACYGFLDGPAEAVSGACPACGTNVSNVFECPECGLSLSFDPRDLMQGHPFTVFLSKMEQSGELPQ